MRIEDDDSRTIAKPAHDIAHHIEARFIEAKHAHLLQTALAHRAQLRVGTDGAVVVTDAGADRVTPTGGLVSSLVKVRVPDVDTAFARAREHGARAVEEPQTWEYGERSAVLEDPGGHRWELTQTVRDVEPEEWGGVTVAPW